MFLGAFVCSRTPQHLSRALINTHILSHSLDMYDDEKIITKKNETKTKNSNTNIMKRRTNTSESKGAAETKRDENANIQDISHMNDEKLVITKKKNE